MAGYECIHKSLLAPAATDTGGGLCRGSPSAFMWPHHREPQAALTHDRLRPPDNPGSCTTLPLHCRNTCRHTHTHTHMRRHASPEPPTNTQAKQNKSGSNNLIQFDWPDEQVLLAKETLLREAERGKRGLQRERWREGDSVRLYARASRYASSICCVYSMSLRVVHAPPSSPLAASLLPAPPADSSSLPA